MMNKKETIKALEEKWGDKAAFLGTPSFAYEIKTDTQTFIIDRHGVIRDLQGLELHAEELLSEELANEATSVSEAASAEKVDFKGVDG